MDFAAIFTDYSWIPLLCIVAGLILIIIEMFHPGFGLPGVMGIILLTAGIILYAKTVLQALILVAVVLAVLGAALAIVLQSATRDGWRNISCWTAPLMMTSSSLHSMISVTCWEVKEKHCRY